MVFETNSFSDRKKHSSCCFMSLIFEQFLLFGCLARMIRQTFSVRMACKVLSHVIFCTYCTYVTLGFFTTYGTESTPKCLVLRLHIARRARQNVWHVMRIEHVRHVKIFCTWARKRVWNVIRQNQKFCRSCFLFL